LPLPLFALPITVFDTVFTTFDTVFDTLFTTLLTEVATVFIALCGDTGGTFGIVGTGTDPLVKNAKIPYIINNMTAIIIIAGA
jgi:hypothetical protein